MIAFDARQKQPSKKKTYNCNRQEYRENSYGKRYYRETMERAKATGCALLAVEADILWRWWDAGEQSFSYPNVELNKYGFTSQQKNTVLRKFEEAGWISVQWRGKKSPIVTLLKRF